MKQAAKIDRSQFPAIRRAIESLGDWPNCRNIKALVGLDGYRLRVGRYRVLFTVHTSTVCIIRIEEVKKRDEHTY